jgi:hypothetical protein
MLMFSQQEMQWTHSVSNWAEGRFDSPADTKNISTLYSFQTDSVVNLGSYSIYKVVQIWPGTICV